MSDTETFSVVDLFSGCGGLSLGFEKVGFDVLCGLDSWQWAVETYNKNFEHLCVNIDVGDVGAVAGVLAPFFEDSKGLRPGIIGGPPCQDFSSAGKRVEGSRAGLTEKFAEVVRLLHPGFVVMENVPQALKAQSYQSALSMLRDAGYEVGTIVLDASKCGVPQRRKRLFALGFEDGEILDVVLESLHGEQASKSMTVRDYFGEDLDFEHYYNPPRSYARRGVFSVDEPAPTIRGVNRPVPPGYESHRGDTAPISEVRALSSRERARIQTFPDWFEFVGARTNVEQLIGNAVPVNLAAFVAERVRRGLESV